VIEALDVARFVGAVTIGTYRFPILIRPENKTSDRTRAMPGFNALAQHFPFKLDEYSIPAKAQPVGVVISNASVSETKPMPNSVAGLGSPIFSICLCRCRKTFSSSHSRRVGMAMKTGALVRAAYGKSVTFGVMRGLVEVGPPTSSMTLLISPRLSRATVIM
jgi:hypothetical protein